MLRKGAEPTTVQDEASVTAAGVISNTCWKDQVRWHLREEWSQGTMRQGEETEISIRTRAQGWGGAPGRNPQERASTYGKVGIRDIV